MRTLTTIRSLGNYLLDFSFEDGTKKIVNLKPLTDYPAFEPIRDVFIWLKTKCVTSNGKGLILI